MPGDVRPDNAEKTFRAVVREYAGVYRDAAVEWDRSDEVDIAPLMERARQYQLTGLILSEAYGGRDLGALEWAMAVEEIARTARSWIPAEPLFMTSGPGPAMILASENETLKKEVLPVIAAGEGLAAISITEPAAGSAMTDLSTTGVEDGDDFIIDGGKRHITGAGQADFLVTFCRFGSTPGAKGIGAVLIERDRAGVDYGRNPEWLGLRGIPHLELSMNQVRVPRRNLLFEPGQFGRLMRAFNLERLHNATVSVGLAAAALDSATEFVRRREQFGRPIVEFQGVQWQIADMYVELEAARSLVYKAARDAVEGKYPQALDVSIAKLFSNEMGIRVAHRAADLHGAAGYTKDHVVERLLRDCLVMPVAGGTVNVLRNTIAAELFKGVPLSQRRPAGSDQERRP